MSHISRLFAVWVILAGCGLVEHQAANAEDDAVSVPLGSRDIEAYLDPNQRALVLSRYDERGQDLLKANLPVVQAPEFAASDIVIVEFEPELGPSDIEQQLRTYVRRGVIEEVAFVAHTGQGAEQQPFLLGNSATIYVAEGTDKATLSEHAANLGFRLESRAWGSKDAYRMLPLDPLQAPSETVNAAARLAEMGLVEEGKTRMNLIETERDKMR